MAKISPVSIKYMIRAKFTAEGALEKPDVIGAIFGQTEGLLGSELEMRELQKEGKIGRIEVTLERNDRKTTGIIDIPTALDQSETTLIAAAIETIDRIGPSEAQIEIEAIEDVRVKKRDYIIDRAKKLMKEIHGSADSREISKEIKDSAKISDIEEYGDEKLPAGDLTGTEIIVVEGRADVINLIRNGVGNAIAMNGTKLPRTIKELSNEKEITLFVDGDRGGKLIVQNVLDNARIRYIAVAPDGKEVEELTGKEILMQLRKRMQVREYLARERYRSYDNRNGYNREEPEAPAVKPEKVFEIKDEEKKKLKEISESNEGTDKAIILDENLEELKKISIKTLASNLKKFEGKAFALVIDGTVTSPMIKSAEEINCKIIVGKNFASVDTSIKLLSL